MRPRGGGPDPLSRRPPPQLDKEESREVTKAEGQAFARAHGCLFLVRLPIEHRPHRVPLRRTPSPRLLLATRPRSPHGPLPRTRLDTAGVLCEEQGWRPGGFPGTRAAGA